MIYSCFSKQVMLLDNFGIKLVMTNRPENKCSFYNCHSIRNNTKIRVFTYYISKRRWGTPLIIEQRQKLLGVNDVACPPPTRVTESVIHFGGELTACIRHYFRSMSYSLLQMHGGFEYHILVQQLKSLGYRNKMKNGRKHFRPAFCPRRWNFGAFLIFVLYFLADNEIDLNTVEIFLRLFRLLSLYHICECFAEHLI